MTYADTASLVEDQQWQRRLVACGTEQALVFINDARPEFNVLAGMVIEDSSVVLNMRWIVASQPVGGDWEDDATMRGAVQSAWPLYGAQVTD